MAERPRRVDLRLTIPAAGDFRPVAADVAGRFAEYSGASADAAARFGKAVDAAVVKVAADPDAEVAIALEADAGEITAAVDAGGRTERVRCPVPTR